MLEQGIGQAGGARDDACSRRRHDLDRHAVERIGRAETEGCRRGGAHALARPAQRLQHGETRWPEAGGRDQTGERGGCVAIGGQRQHAGTGLQMRTQAIELAAVKGNERAFGERPAEPGGRQAERRRRRHHHGLGRRHMPRQHRPDAVVIGIAGGEHANLSAALRQHLRDTVLERRWPGPRRAADERSRKSEMALAAEHDLGAGHSPRAAAARPSIPSSPMPTMDSQRGAAAVWSAITSGRDMRRILILGGTTQARELAQRLAGRPDLT